MDYYVFIWSVCLFVENRVQGETELAELARQMGFSLAHTRALFRRYTGKTLARYVQERKLANAAQTLLHTDEDLMNVALRYGYSGRDVFSRAFRRYTGYTPSEFRAARPPMMRVKLCAGVYGAALPQKQPQREQEGE